MRTKNQLFSQAIDIFFSFSKQTLGCYRKIFQHCIVLHPSQFIIYCHPLIRSYLTCTQQLRSAVNKLTNTRKSSPKFSVLSRKFMEDSEKGRLVMSSLHVCSYTCIRRRYVVHSSLDYNCICIVGYRMICRLKLRKKLQNCRFHRQGRTR